MHYTIKFYDNDTITGTESVTYKNIAAVKRRAKYVVGENSNRVVILNDIDIPISVGSVTWRGLDNEIKWKTCA